MSRMKQGFTLIEVILFLTLTSALFVGIAVGTNNSIYQQRFNDSVQNFVEFLRGIYTQVSNVENQGAGRSGRAIYGKLITFGESMDLAGNDVSGQSLVFTYDVIGNVGDVGTGDALSALSALNANVIFFDDQGTKSFYSAGMAGSYSPRWSAGIEIPSDYKAFTGSILIVRHPRSGTVFTYYYDGIIEVNKAKNDINKMLSTMTNEMEINNLVNTGVNPIKDLLSNKAFKVSDIDFCINPEAGQPMRLRRNVRLVKGSRNASGILVMNDDEGSNNCIKN